MNIVKNMTPTMNKLSQTDKDLVDKCKEVISSYTEQQNKAYEELCTKLGHDSEWLFDYIYNTYTDDNEYTKFVLTNLFE